MSTHPALAPERLVPPSAGQLRRLLAAERLRPRKALSQNFLTDGAVLDQIVATAELEPGDRIVEVGPGLGVLTLDCWRWERPSWPSSSTHGWPPTCVANWTEFRASS